MEVMCFSFLLLKFNISIYFSGKTRILRQQRKFPYHGILIDMYYSQLSIQQCYSTDSLHINLGNVS